jgi:hypothetical protein
MTKRRALVLAGAAALCLAAWAWWSSARRGEAAEVQRLADLVAKKDDAALKKGAERVARKYKDLGPFMKVFRPRTAKGGGLGVGPKAGAIQPEGIEARIKELARRAPGPEEMEQQSRDLQRLCWVTAAVAEVTRHKCEVAKPVGKLDPRDWSRWSEDMQQSALDLAEAVNDRDGARVKEAAALLYSSCTSCHRIFRE